MLKNILRIRNKMRSHEEPFEAQRVVQVVSAEFDVDFYLKTNPDVAAKGMNPIQHYLQYGAGEMRDPNSTFNTESYLATNPDVAESGVNPFWHYLTHGRAEGRQMCAMDDLPPSADEARDTSKHAVVSAEFDTAFYEGMNPDLKDWQGTPLDHYMSVGWKEHRDPHPNFSVAYYLRSNTDVAEAGIEPYWHYLVAGRSEGRLPTPPDEQPIFEFLFNLPDVDEETEVFEAPRELLSAPVLTEALRQSLDFRQNTLLLSIGHDEYTEQVGGVQIFLQQEEQLATSSGVTYLNLSPHRPANSLLNEDGAEAQAITLILDGKKIGAASYAVLCTALAELKGRGTRSAVVIHQLLGHAPEQITRLRRSCAVDECWLWLHDYFTLCPGYTLMRNKLAYCAAPPAASFGCQVCCFGTARKPHLRRIARFFEENSVHVVSPSEVTKEIWLAKGALPHASLTVLPHVRVHWQDTDGNLPVDATRRIRVAFAGLPVRHKGWGEFKQIMQQFQNDPRFEFYYLGTGETEVNITRIPVQVDARNRNAMADAIRENDIDFVMHWALCPETFSFSTTEAIAGDALVLTNRASGNVAALVEAYDQGIVFDDAAQLQAFFEGDQIDKTALDARRRKAGRVAELEYSATTLPLILDGVCQ